jgi:hypothetical protein
VNDQLGRPVAAPGVAAGNRGPVPGTLGQPQGARTPAPGTQGGRPVAPQPPVAAPSGVPAVQPPIPPPSAPPAQPAGPAPAQPQQGAVQPSMLGQPQPAAVLSRVPSDSEFAAMGPGATVQTPYGQVVAGQDGKAQVVLDEAGRAAYVAARARATAEFGDMPTWASGPGAPAPPVRVGRQNFNPLTGQWSGGGGSQREKLADQGPIKQPPVAAPAPADPSGGFGANAGARLPYPNPQTLAERQANAAALYSPAQPGHGGGYQGGPPPPVAPGPPQQQDPPTNPIAALLARRRAGSLNA